MKQIWNDRRMFVTVLGVIGSSVFPAAAPFIAGIVGAYMANRAYVDGKTKEPKV